MNLRILFMYYFVPILFVLYFVWRYWENYLFWFHYFCVFSILCVISWIISYFLHEGFNREVISEPENKAILISSGDVNLALELAFELDRLGFHVFVGVSNFTNKVTNIRNITKKCSKRFKILPMDSTKILDVENVVLEIRKSKTPLWAVVNCAENSFGAFTDWGNDVDDYRDILEENLFGLIRVTKCCLPLLRESSGSRIVNFGSIFGRITFPGSSHLSMSKHCVRVYSDALRRELLLTKSQIKVITIETTLSTSQLNLTKLKLTSKQIFDNSSEPTKQYYNTKLPLEKCIQKVEKFLPQISHSNNEKTINSLLKAITLANPKQSYQCYGYADVLTFSALWFAPEILVDFILTNM